MTSEQSLAASSTSFSVTIATVNISNSYQKSTEHEDLAVKMLTEKGKIYKTCSKWHPFIRSLKPLFPLIDGAVITNECQPKV